jgi:hypothetical protein
MRTMFVPGCMRLSCLQRTPLLRSKDARGARGSSSLAFFIWFYLDCEADSGKAVPNPVSVYTIDRIRHLENIPTVMKRFSWIEC